MTCLLWKSSLTDLRISAESGLIIRTYPTEGEMVSKKTSTIYLYIKEEGTVSSSSSSGSFSGGPVGVRPDDDDDE